MGRSFKQVSDGARTPSRSAEVKLHDVSSALQFLILCLTNCSICNGAFHLQCLDFTLNEQPEAYFSFLTLGTLSLLSRLDADEIAQLHFNWHWQHVVPDKKHIFSRDCSHQLGLFFFLFGPSIELNFSGKRNSSLWVTKCQGAELEGRGFKNTFEKPVNACVCMRRLASITQPTYGTYAELVSVCKTLKGHDFDL